MTLTPLTTDIMRAAKWSFTTRRVNRQDAAAVLADLSRAQPGDLVLGRVLKIGAHKRIQLPTGRPSHLFRGDLVVLACGARYAPDQFEGTAELSPKGADMLAGGGVLGRMRDRNARMSDPTRVLPLGLLARGDGSVCNVQDYALAQMTGADGMSVIGVIGASMNSGKTTAAASLAHGLMRAGHRVAAVKVTGTGAFGDFNAYLDAGAHFVADFVDTGMATTYRQPLPRIVAATDTLLAHAARDSCAVAVVELADGVLQAETAALLADPAYRARFDGWIYAVPDEVAAAGGVAHLARSGIVPAVLTGKLSASPMAVREAVSVTGLAVRTREDLMDPALASALVRGAAARQPRVGVPAEGVAA